MLGQNNAILRAWQQHKICDALQTVKCKLALCLLYEDVSPEIKAKYDCHLVVGSPRIVSGDVIPVIMPLPMMSQCPCACAGGMFILQRDEPLTAHIQDLLAGIHSKKTYRCFRFIFNLAHLSNCCSSFLNPTGGKLRR